MIICICSNESKSRISSFALGGENPRAACRQSDTVEKHRLLLSDIGFNSVCDHVTVNEAE